ncbi:permease prefix domain 1-containing protein [Agathobaculum sp. LCP25S3_E8]|uniref:permease prefix domain 1-containing protein n=1 Tax=Agathobaculum sp. LCP25S3_E8 TaxID=3438735 RepID=UPI003F8F1667
MSSDERITHYLNQVCHHLFWPPYRARVRRELTDHILSRIEYLENERGDSHDEAVTTALLGLGDPDTLGEMLRCARFPVSYLFCLLLTFLIWAAIAGCLVYLLLYFFF